MNFLFKENSKHFKELNLILKEIYSLDLKPLQKSLDKIIQEKEVTSSDNIKHFQNLTNFSKYLNLAEETMNKLNCFDYTNQDTLQKQQQITHSGNSLDLVINELIFRQEKTYNYLDNELNYNQNSLESLNKLRKNLGIQNNLALDLIQLGNQRDVFYFNEEIFYNYQDKQEKLDSLDHRIQSLEQRYDNLEFCQNIKKERKSILKELKDGFKKSKLVKSCLKENYFEGTLRLQQLKANITIKNHNSSNNKIDKPPTELNYQDNYGFNFYAYVLKMSSPQNFNYYTIQDLLVAKYGGNESERFSKLAKIIKKEKIKGKPDFDYMRTILFGFEQALNSPSEGFAQGEAKEVYHALKYSLRQAS